MCYAFNLNQVYISSAYATQLSIWIISLTTTVRWLHSAGFTLRRQRRDPKWWATLLPTLLSIWVCLLRWRCSCVCLCVCEFAFAFTCRCRCRRRCLFACFSVSVCVCVCAKFFSSLAGSAWRSLSSIWFGPSRLCLACSVCCGSTLDARRCCAAVLLSLASQSQLALPRCWFRLIFTKSRAT